MQELLQQVLAIARGMWHRRWIGLVVAWAAAIIGVAVVYRIPERYEASARVYVDTESLLRPLLAGLAIQPNIDQQVALISRTLISRPNVEKLVRMADLDLGTASNADREDMVDKVTKSIRLEGNVAQNLYVISYRDSNPAQARKVVQSLLTIFVESSLGDKRQDTQTAVKFLDDQIKSYEKNLQAAEDRIKDFRLKYMGVTSGAQGQDYFGRVAQLNSEIDQARLELESAEQARDSYKKELAGEQPPDLLQGSTTGTEVNDAVPEIDTRLQALRQDLDGLLRKYTDEHPDVVATKRLVSQLEAERAAVIEARRRAAQDAPKGQQGPPTNPLVQQMKLSLADAEASVASARAKVAGLEAQQRQLKAQAQRVPAAEAEYTQLTRDYDVLKRTYENLLSRRESASMGKDVQDTSGAQFRVIDPPRVSPQPVAPNRLALLGLAFVLSIGAGLFASLAASQLMPTFHDARALREISRRPILGMVSMLPSQALARIRRRNAWLFAGGVGSLLATFSAAFAFVLLVGRV
ncbi:MAG: XrtA system polysaccharide chain length determinant [Deltaproteobacteria bacterium]